MVGICGDVVLVEEWIENLNYYFSRIWTYILWKEGKEDLFGHIESVVLFGDFNCLCLLCGRLLWLTGD